jgi:hypothetical protein
MKTKWKLKAVRHFSCYLEDILYIYYITDEEFGDYLSKTLANIP